MLAEIISAPLTNPPLKANNLSSKDNLLALWQSNGPVVAQDHREYHFAIHSPVWGWRGYCWDKKYGMPRKIFPATQDIVWCHTNEKYLMRLQIAQNGEATISGMVSPLYEPLDANENGCLFREDRRIRYLHFNKNIYTDISTRTHWAQAWLLPDDAITVFDDYRIIAVSPEGEMVYEETVPLCNYYPPFLTYRKDNSFYYTDDPRKGWDKSDVLNMIQKHMGSRAYARFFTILYDKYYIAVDRENGCETLLYRFSSKSPECIEYVWRITTTGGRYDLVRHKALLCLASRSCILGCSNTYIQENDGFLVWEPILNTFYTDIPRTTSIQRISTARTPSVCIPDLWVKNIQQQR